MDIVSLVIAALSLAWTGLQQWAKADKGEDWKEYVLRIGEQVKSELRKEQNAKSDQ